jgi:hypothetical protein
LAQDFQAARVADDVLDGEEEGFVFELGDQGQFGFDGLQHFRRRAIGPAFLHALHRQREQMTGGCFARRHQFLRIDVVELAQIEDALPRDVDRSLQQGVRIDIA